jgi:hypothetical protein
MHGSRRQALAAATVADHADHPSGMQVEADSSRCADGAGVLEEVHHQVAHRHDATCG